MSWGSNIPLVVVSWSSLSPPLREDLVVVDDDVEEAARELMGLPGRGAGLNGEATPISTRRRLKGSVYVCVYGELYVLRVWCGCREFPQEEEGPETEAQRPHITPRRCVEIDLDSLRVFKRAYIERTELIV